MKIIREISELQTEIEAQKSKKKTIGFIPTMGALHKGHLSLISCSDKDTDINVVSIFVNPTQFNNKQDLQKYPRDEQNDLKLLKQTSCSIVFIPEVKQMYPAEDKRIFDFKGLDKVMEGKFREGHFNGVAQIVSKLFEIIKPHKAYFGKKDFQQVAIINYMNEKYLKDLNIQIQACDIIREDDGLAMSSRNMLLTTEQRKSAANINKIMNYYMQQYDKMSVDDLKVNVIRDINKLSELNTEYLEIVNNKDLQTVNEIIPGQTTACIAVFAGNVRLIDNYSF